MNISPLPTPRNRFECELNTGEGRVGATGVRVGFLGEKGVVEGLRGHSGHPQFSQGVHPIPRARRGRRVLPRAGPGPIFPVSTNPQTCSVFELHWGDLLWERGPQGTEGRALWGSDG